MRDIVQSDCGFAEHLGKTLEEHRPLSREHTSLLLTIDSLQLKIR